MTRTMIAALACGLALSACGKQDLADTAGADGLAPESPAIETVDVANIDTVADLPRSIVVDDPHLKADVTFDEALFAKAPAIAMDVVEDAQIRIEAMLQDAKDYREADPDFFQPYVLRIDWKVVAEAGDVMSLEGFIFTYTAGAHGNYFTDARIYDSLTGKRMRLSEFFSEPQNAVRSHMNRVWLAAADQKLLKSGGRGNRADMQAEVEDLISADMVLAGLVSFAPSTEPGKFGGYTVHFAPYEIGSYAEGSYHITVPQQVFRDRLRQRYTNLFAGEPVEVTRADSPR